MEIEGWNSVFPLSCFLAQTSTEWRIWRDPALIDHSCLRWFWDVCIISLLERLPNSANCHERIPKQFVTENPKKSTLIVGTGEIQAFLIRWNGKQNILPRITPSFDKFIPWWTKFAFIKRFSVLHTFCCASALDINKWKREGWK